MQYFSVLLAVLGAFASGAVTFKVLGKFTVNVHLVSAGSPVHLTLSAAMLAVEKIVAGETGTFQSGNVSVSISD